MHKRITRLMIVLLAGYLQLPIAGAATKSLLPERLEASVEARIKAGDYPAVVIGFVRGEQSGVYSFGSLQDSEKPDADTLFEIGSITKTFTGLLLADAVISNQVSAETPVSELMPGMKFPALDGKVITLGNLATQHSGLPRLPANLRPADGTNPYADYHAPQLKEFLEGLSLSRAPGGRYEYSNLGYGLLGLALARRADTTYGKLMVDRVLTPLGMQDTGVHLQGEHGKRIAAGHDQTGKVTGNWDFDVLAGAGALKSSGADMLRYLKANMGLTETALLPAMQMAHKPRAKVGAGTDIGFGWMTHTAGARKVIWHNGMTGGYASFIGFTDDGAQGVVILTNTAKSVDDLGFAALLPDAKLAPARKALEMSPEALDDYVGNYRLAPKFVLAIFREGGQLFARATGQNPFPIFPSAANEFFARAIDAQITFSRDADGIVDALVLHQNGDHHGPRVSDREAAKETTDKAVVNLAPATLREYAGEYQLAPTVKVTVTVQGEQLHVQLTGQQAYPVFATEKDEFFYTVVDAQIAFERDDQGKVNALVLHQGGVDQRAPKNNRR